MRPAPRRPSGCKNLGQHAAAADRAAGTARHFLQFGITGHSVLHQRSIRRLARIGGIQARLIRQDDQCIGLDQIGHQRAQRIVVAEADFVDGDGVVFVDDGDGVEVEQGTQGTACIEVALAVGQVVVRQQHLRGMQMMFREARFVHLHQAHLANCGSRLQFVDGSGTLGPAQSLHAFSDGTTGDQHHLAPESRQLCNLLRPRVDGGLIQAAPVIGDQAGAHLDDNRARTGQ